MVKICKRESCENTVSNSKRLYCDIHTPKKTKECANENCTNVPTAKRLICDICQPLGTCGCGRVLPDRKKTICDECRNKSIRLCSCGKVTGYRSDICVDCKVISDGIREICEEVLCDEPRIGKCRLCAKHQGVYSQHRETYRKYSMKWNDVTSKYRFNDCICVVCKDEDKLQCTRIYCTSTTTKDFSVCKPCDNMSRKLDFKKRRNFLENAGIFGTTCSKCKNKKLFKYFDHSSDKCNNCNTECTTKEIEEYSSNFVYTMGNPSISYVNPASSSNVDNVASSSDAGNVASSSSYVNPASSSFSDVENVASSSDRICSENYCTNGVHSTTCTICDNCKDIHEKHRKVIRKYFSKSKNSPENKGCSCKECKKIVKMCKNIFCNSTDFIPPKQESNRKEEERKRSNQITRYSRYI
jgi:hypothetical protein